MARNRLSGTPKGGFMAREGVKVKKGRGQSRGGEGGV